MKIVLLGAPGSGKGTHSDYLEKQLSIPHISTGDIFRKAIQDKTPLGVLAKSLIDDGNLVPDEVTIDLVKGRLEEDDCINGYLLDGFPRTISQAEALNKFSKPDIVFYLDLSLNEALNRLLNRRVCENCSAIFNLLHYNSSLCQKCGGKLIVRKDDNEDAIKKRFDIYNTVTKPLKNFYEQMGLLKVIDVNRGISEIRETIDGVLGEFNA